MTCKIRAIHPRLYGPVGNCGNLPASSVPRAMKSRAKRDSPIVQAATCPLCGAGNPRRVWESSGVSQVSADQAFLCTTTERIRPEILEYVPCLHIFSNPANWPPNLGREYEILINEEYLQMLLVKRRTFSRAADVLQRHLKPPASSLEAARLVT